MTAFNYHYPTTEEAVGKKLPVATATSTQNYADSNGAAQLFRG